MNKKQQSITYNELISTFKCARNKTLPAEIHGYLCGLICSGSCLKGSGGFKITTDMLKEDFFAKPENQKTIARLMVIAFEQLQDSDFEFELMLPNDDEKIKWRMESLSKWCQQFISGLGIGGINQKMLDKTKLSESLYDLSEIARANYSQINEDETSEFSYAELVEYVRMAVIGFFMETFRPEDVIEPLLPALDLEDEPPPLH
jgi:hypothetical protein